MLIFIRQQEELFQIHNQQIQNLQYAYSQEQECMRQLLREEMTGHLEHLESWIDQGRNPVQYHMHQVLIHQQLVLANQYVVEGLIVKRDEIQWQYEQQH